MMIMPANYAGWEIHVWATRCPGVLGHLWSPPRTITIYPHLDYVCDNRRWIDAENRKPWSETVFLDFCEQLRWLPKKPLFLLVPDVPRSAEGTLNEWQRWEERLRKYDLPLAFALQDGIELKQIPQSADWLFVGGTDDWRYPRLPEIVAMGKPVHVGRINTPKRIWQCHGLGVKSVDGTGYFKGDRYCKQGLESYLRYCEQQLYQVTQPRQISLLQPQLSDRRIIREQDWRRIPSNITRGHLLMAIDHWARWREQQGQGRSLYFVNHDGKHYPVKQLLSYANLYANGIVLPVNHFSGGACANRFLEQRGFEIQLKASGQAS